MEYVIMTKRDGRKLASLQPSREEAAESWARLNGEDTGCVLEMMSDRERAQGGDSHAHRERRVFTLEVPVEQGAYPYMLWGDGVGELPDLHRVPAAQHRTETLGGGT